MGEDTVKGVFSVNEGTIRRKIKFACDKAGITMTELGSKMGLKQAAFSQRLKTGRFTKEELEKIAVFLGCEYVCYFELDSGEKV